MTKEEFDRITEMADIRLKDEERIIILNRLNKIWEIVKEIENVNTEGIEALVNPLELNNVMREDVIDKSSDVTEILTNAPNKKGEYFTVPNIIDND